MQSNSVRLTFLFLLLAACGLSAAAQNKSNYQNREFCSDNWSNGDRAMFKELRETTVPASSLVAVDSGRNGGIRVIGENRADVFVRACVQAWADSDARAREMVKNIRVETGSTIRAQGNESNWAVSYEIHTPRSMNLRLNTENGGIGVSGVEGAINFEALNGGIHLDQVAGDIKGRTQNGGVHIELSGNNWRGKGLDVETTNGGVNLIVPANYAAHLETQTMNGGFSSNLSGVEDERRNNNGYYRMPGVKISKDINGGGALVRVVTTNGGVRINSK